MNCHQAQQLFDAYLDGELTGPLLDELGAHRVRCDDCRRALDLLTVAGQVVATDAVAPGLTDDFSTRVLAAALRRPRRQPWRRLAWVAVPLAAAACLAMVFWGGSPDAAVNRSTAAGTTQVAGVRENVEDLNELRGNVAEALRNDPSNTQLQRMLDLLDHTGRSVVEQTRDRTRALENYGKRTMMDVLESVQRNLEADSAPPAAVENTDDRSTSHP